MIELIETLTDVWEGAIANAYKQGQLSNQITLQAAFYEGIRSMTELEVWLTPTLRFPSMGGVIFDRLRRFQHEQWLANQEPAILLTDQEEVVAAMEVHYAPDNYPDFRREVKRLVSLKQLAGISQLYLGLDPYQGNPQRDTLYRISPDLLCAYALISQRSAFALNLKALQQDHPTSVFPSPFLLLTGSVQDQSVRFQHRVA